LQQFDIRLGNRWKRTMPAMPPMPPQMGIEMDSSKPWYVIDMHYDNPRGLTGIQYASGLEITTFSNTAVTNENRLWAGASTTSFTIPPCPASPHDWMKDLDQSATTNWSFSVLGRRSRRVLSRLLFRHGQLWSLLFRNGLLWILGSYHLCSQW
jgi:hypothetical protein